MSDVEYDLEAMKKAIEQCDKNIETFENAIRQEEETKRQYKKIVRRLQRGSDDSSVPKP